MNNRIFYGAVGTLVVTGVVGLLVAMMGGDEPALEVDTAGRRAPAGVPAGVPGVAPSGHRADGAGDTDLRALRGEVADLRGTVGTLTAERNLRDQENAALRAERDALQARLAAAETRQPVAQDPDDEGQTRQGFHYELIPGGVEGERVFVMGHSTDPEEARRVLADLMEAGLEMDALAAMIERHKEMVPSSPAEARPYVGISPMAIETSSEETPPRGVPVQTFEGSPASTAGIATGDRIFQCGEDPVSNFSELAAAIRKHEPGETVSFWCNRDGSEFQAWVTIGTRP